MYVTGALGVGPGFPLGLPSSWAIPLGNAGSCALPLLTSLQASPAPGGYHSKHSGSLREASACVLMIKARVHIIVVF